MKEEVSVHGEEMALDTHGSLAQKAKIFNFVEMHLCSAWEAAVT